MFDTIVISVAKLFRKIYLKEPMYRLLQHTFDKTIFSGNQRCQIFLHYIAQKLKESLGKQQQQGIESVLYVIFKRDKQQFHFLIWEKL